MSPFQINKFLLFKLPAAYLCGVRLLSIDSEKTQVYVRFAWINQNPFKSMFWAVQGMAAELASGMLVMQFIRSQNRSISMLLIGVQAEFYKKAKGKILFTCSDGAIAQRGVSQCSNNPSGAQFELTTVGYDNVGDLICRFKFQWSVKSR